jgi:uncharacterized repeat protein (TIGR04076 family)
MQRFVKEESGRLCIYVLMALAPYLTALCRDTPKEDWINNVEVIQCPDPKRAVVFKVERKLLR